LRCNRSPFIAPWSIFPFNKRLVKLVDNFGKKIGNAEILFDPGNNESSERVDTFEGEINPVDEIVKIRFSGITGRVKIRLFDKSRIDNLEKFVNDRGNVPKR